MSLLLIGKIMYTGHNNMTMEMTPATFPIITIEKDGRRYNQLHGYGQPMNTAFQRDTITVLGESRDTGIVIDTYGNTITGISMQVRNMEGSRLIEDTQIQDYAQNGETISANLALKDLIERDTEYVLTIVLELENRKEIYYYTRVIWSDTTHMLEKLSFVEDFHNRLYDKAAARELTKYLETNSQLESNSSFHKVNIHSSFKQITWGDMPIEEVGEPVIQLTDIAKQTASVAVYYTVATTENREPAYYEVEEYYRVRYTSERMYLLNYEREMTQIANVDSMYANDKILLGITDENIQMLESEDGNIVVFEVGRRLFSYNITTNKLAVIFSFFDEENADARTMYGQHAIKILDVDEGGNVKFAVYGYMNRGRHEGEVGIQICHYDSGLNTVEEDVYMPCTKAFAVLKKEMEQLLYLNRDQHLYISWDNIVYDIDLNQKCYKELVEITQDDSMQVSQNHRIMVWQEGTDIYQCQQLNVRNLNTDMQSMIKVGEEEAIRPLGFMGEDVIYGVARRADIVKENSGRVFFPMYKICICSSNGELLKEYMQPGIYIMDCQIVDNQITLKRVSRSESGVYQSTMDDHIMNNIEEEIGKNVIVAADIDVYERYVQIRTRNTIDSKTIKILTPKEVVFEGGRELELVSSNTPERYYVYGAKGVDGIYHMPGRAVNQAYDIGGVVVNKRGECVWMKGNRVNKNQIMAIKEETVTPEKNSLAVCLDTMLKFEGIIRNSHYLLAQGQTVMDILEENLPDAQILDLSGCNLDAVLYYVNQDIPVLAMLDDGEAVLITGFNEFNVVIMEPRTGLLYKKGMNDSTEWFAENGNHFVTYARMK